MSTSHAVANAYLALWNESSTQRRSELLREGWSERARYVDPIMQGEGHAGIAAMIEGAREQFPGFRFELAGNPDGHGSYARFSWRLISPNGDDVAGGTDMVRLGTDGRIKEVIGFLDRAPG